MSSLAEVLKVTSVLALAEENGHALCHVDPQKPIEVSDHCGDRSQRDCFGNSMLPKVFPAERGDLHVELYHKGTI